MAVAVSSVVVAIFDVKYNFHLQVRVLPPSFHVLSGNIRHLIIACPTHLKGPPGENKVLGWPRTQPCSIGGSLRIMLPFQIQASSSSGSLFSTILA